MASARSKPSQTRSTALSLAQFATPNRSDLRLLLRDQLRDQRWKASGVCWIPSDEDSPDDPLLVDDDQLRDCTSEVALVVDVRAELVSLRGVRRLVDCDRHFEPVLLYIVLASRGDLLLRG